LIGIDLEKHLISQRKEWPFLRIEDLKFIKISVHIKIPFKNHKDNFLLQAIRKKDFG